MAWYNRARGAQIEPNVLPPSIALTDGGTYGNRKVGPGGGWGWGGGPRWFVGSRGNPEPPVVELGQPGDFVEGEHEWGPAEGDLGFPHATRWPGYPGCWEQPFYQPPGGRSLGPVGPSGGLGGMYGSFSGGGLLDSRVSTVFTCTDLISRTIASMALSVTRNSTPVLAPAWVDNPEPLLYTSMVDAMKAIVNSMLLRGESVVAPTARYGDGTVARWVVLNPDMVEIEPDPTTRLPVYSINGIEIPRHQLLHLRYQVWPGMVRGVSPLEAVWRNLVSAEALEQWGTELATNGGIPTAVLQSKLRLNSRQTAELKMGWAEAARSRGVFPVILTGDLTYTPLNLKPADVGLLDLRKFDESRIAGAFGVPLWLVNLPMQEGLTYTTVQGQFDYFWRATLKALVYNITQGLSGWALPRGQWLRADSESLIRPPFQERATAWKTLIDAGVLTTAEVRVFENLAPAPPTEFPAPPAAPDPTDDVINTLAITTDGGS